MSDLQDEFDKALADMRAGKGLRTDTILDQYVQAAMIPLTQDPFDKEALRAAKAALQQQISGENDRRQEAIMKLAFRQRLNIP